MTPFLIGPSAGYFDGNLKAFDELAGTLRERGITVLNPAATREVYDGDERRVILTLLSADSVVLMPGWKNDPAARLHAAVALFLDLPAFTPDMRSANLSAT